MERRKIFITRFLSLASLTIMLILLSACATKLTVHFKPPDSKPPSGTFQAGAAKVDITPPPGYPMGGFGIAGRISRGWWSRLYASSIYLEDKDGNSLVLVSCDLWAMPAGLADRVAEIIGRQNSTAHIGREQIILAATHTHHSPGNYSTSSIYNLLASPQTGFDELLFQFLANRIALSITKAFNSRQPAVIKQNSVIVTGLSRNRSIKAFRKNRQGEINAILSRTQNSDSLFTPDLPGFVTTSEVFQAIDPRLTVLKVEPQKSPGSAPIAVAAFFAVHPTAMGPETEVYSSDIFGVASTLVEQHINGSYEERINVNHPTVVAIFNGAEGDISPNWKQQDRRNTLNIGEGIAKGILEAMENANTLINGAIEYRFKTITVSNQEVNNLHGDSVSSCNTQPPLKTAKKGLPGVAVLGGAEDGRSLFYHMGFREGITSVKCTPRHGYKQSSIDEALEEIFQINPDDFPGDWIAHIAKNVLDKGTPKKLPIGVYSLGPLTMATLPGECTVALGHRISETLGQEAGPEESVLLIGLANEYLSYFTTPQEYNAQHYEGASTMYGEASGLFLEQELGRLSISPANTVGSKRKITYKVGTKVPGGFAKINEDEQWLLNESLKNILQDLNSGYFQRNFPQFSWSDTPNFLNERVVDSEEFVNPQVNIQVKRDGRWVPLMTKRQNVSGEGDIVIAETDSSSLNFVTFVQSGTNNLLNWSTIWMVTPDINADQIVRFQVKTPQEVLILSQEFQIKAILSGDQKPLVSINNKK
jgi:neutral ceramidase